MTDAQMMLLRQMLEGGRPMDDVSSPQMDVLQDRMPRRDGPPVMPREALLQAMPDREWSEMEQLEALPEQGRELTSGDPRLQLILELVQRVAQGTAGRM